MGIISSRRRRKRFRRVMRGTTIAALILLLGVTAASAGYGRILPAWIADGVPAFSGKEAGAQLEITLPEISLYALQLGVFDSGERAADEAQRLKGMGVVCMIWQKEKMRLISDVAFDRQSLDLSTAKGADAYVIEETLPKVVLRIGASSEEIEAIRTLLQLPDDVLSALARGGDPAEACARVRPLAQAALEAHPEHELYTQLAGSLIRWCDMMESREMTGARGYGAASMAALCRELRQALMAESTASAQRTPSTAADVIPPA